MPTLSPRNLNPETRQPTLTLVKNPSRACPDIGTIDEQSRYAEFMGKLGQIADVTLKGF